MLAELTEKVLEDNLKPSESYIGDRDYIGKDGLLHCGKCHTRKEREINWFGKGTRKVPVMCKCKEEANRIRDEQMQHSVLRLLTISRYVKKMKNICN